MSERTSWKVHPCSEAIAAAGMAGKNEAVSNRTKPAETLLLQWQQPGLGGGRGRGWAGTALPTQEVDPMCQSGQEACECHGVSLEASRNSVGVGTEDCLLFHSHPKGQPSLSLAFLAPMTGL